MLQTPSTQAKAHTKENLHIKLFNADGTIAQLWQPNEEGFKLYKETGEWKYTPEHGEYAEELDASNLVVNAGLAGIAKRIGGIGSVAAFDYVAIGTGATAAAAGNTALETEITTGGGARAQVIPTSVTTTVTDDTLQLQKTFAFTSSFAVTEFGVLNAASSGTLLSRTVFSAINVSNGMSVQFTYKIGVS